MAVPLDPARSRALLLDVEGTTTPVDFVYGTLFPFARARLATFLGEVGGEELEALRREHAELAQTVHDLPPWSEERKSVLAFLHWLMDRDRKSTVLKSIQGKIWEEGYHSGELRGSVYADVPPALARWREQGRCVAIFSSGSVLAQKLLFLHSTAGDLTPFIVGYFDTTTGPKQDAQSYGRIAAALGLAPTAILFISDVVAELEAARAAGLATALCVRPGVPEPAGGAHPIVRSFDEVFPGVP